MNRDTWAAAWRHARRLMGPQRAKHGEAALLDIAEREGRRPTLDETCTALRCWQDRHYRNEGAVVREARTRRFYRLADLCSARWEAEAAAEREWG